jgi:hypothetical protein
MTQVMIFALKWLAVYFCRECLDPTALYNQA